MKRLIVTLALAYAGAAPAGAQGGPPPGGGRGPMPVPQGAPGMQGPMRGQMGPGAPGGEFRPEAASMLLSHTSDLKLTDVQVTKLAGIARRAGDRRAALRAKGDSLRESAMRGRPNGTDQQLPKDFEAMRANMEKARQADHEDLRDALAVLTPDQAATAFEMMGRRGGPGGPPPRGARGPGRP